MRRQSLVQRTALVISLLSLILVSFPSFPSTNGPDKQIVNRTLKSDRAVAPMVGKGMRSQPSLSRAEKKVPVGCDRAFGSVSSPGLSNVFGRCLV
jgi:hypothetical protein